MEYYDVDEDEGLIDLEFTDDDILDDRHAEPKGLKGKTVKVEIPGKDVFVGKVTDVDREVGSVVIEGRIRS